MDAVLGDADEVTRFGYRWLLLDNLIHEFNALRGALGEPTEVVYASLARESVLVSLRFGEIPCHLSWVDLMPGIARYKQEFAFYSQEQRLTLELPRRTCATSRAGCSSKVARPDVAQLGARGDRFPRRGVQAGARRVGRLHRNRTHAAYVRSRRPGRPADCVRRWRASTSGWMSSSSQPAAPTQPASGVIGGAGSDGDRTRPDAHRPGRRRANGPGAPRRTPEFLMRSRW